jgi:FixJ family two-component response regulator
MQSDAVVIVAARAERAGLIRMLIEAAGLVPIVFSEHDEVLSAYREKTPAAVVVDLADPHLRPADLLTRLDSEGATSTSVVIAIGRLEGSALDETTWSRVKEVLGDPLDGAQLLHALFDGLSGAGDPKER